MRLPGSDYLRELRQARRFRSLPAAWKEIVFYAEDAASRVHFAPIIRHLIGPLGRRICYLTSSPSDPVLETAGDHLRAFYVGQRLFRTWLFMDLDARVMVMTLPDLESFQVKRSRVHPVHYVYVFHSMVSTHMIYRPQAFDHFDTILAAGPHHEREIRARERIYGLPAKDIVDHGYGRLDSILETAARAGAPGAGGGGDRKRVLVAPTWAPEGLLEDRGVELVEAILAGGFQVTVRPHPMTAKKWPRAIEALDRFRAEPAFELETDVASQESLHRSDLMISDYSGAALEYALGLERPVLFVDVPRKVRNADYRRLGCQPVEVSLRSEIGEVLPAAELARIAEVIDRLCAEPERFRRRIRRVRERTIYNVGRSGIAGAEAIARLAGEEAPAGE